MKRGFTVIELLIVAAIIGIMVAIAVPNFIMSKIESQYEKLSVGGELNKEEKESLKKYLIKWPDRTKGLRKKYGDSPCDILGIKYETKVQEAPKKETKTQANMVLIDEVKRLKQELAAKKDKPHLYTYRIVDKRDAQGWKYDVVRDDGEIMVVLRRKSEAEKIQKALEDSRENGRTVGQHEGKHE